MKPEQQTVTAKVTKKFNEPTERVFDAWLNTGMIGKWMFGPAVRDEQILRIEIDLRKGRFSFVVERQDNVINHVGEYLEIQRPGKLVFTWGVKGEPAGESTVSVDIKPTSDGCELNLAHELTPESADFASKSEEAWIKMLNALEKALKNDSPSW